MAIITKKTHAPREMTAKIDLEVSNDHFRNNSLILDALLIVNITASATGDGDGKHGIDSKSSKGWAGDATYIPGRSGHLASSR